MNIPYFYHKRRHLKELEKYNLKLEIDVRWADMDAFNHVNNAIYLKWVECARVEYLTNNVTGLFGEKILGPILARQDCRYIFPMKFPDTAIIGFRVNEIGEDRLLCEASVYSKKHQKLSAIVYNTVMAYNFQKLEKSYIPNEWIEKIENFEQKQ